MSLAVAFPSMHSMSQVNAPKKLSRDVLHDTTPTGSSTSIHEPVSISAESTWHKRKPTHLAPLLNTSGKSHDAPSTSTGPSTSAACSGGAADTTQKRTTRFERLRLKLGGKTPATAVFPAPSSSHAAPPRTPRAARAASPAASPSRRARSRSRARSVTRRQADDARSIAFSISSGESAHSITLTTRVKPSSHKTKHEQAYFTGALPPVPRIPEKYRSSQRGDADDDEAGLLRPRLKMAAGSMIGGADFKAAQRARMEGRALKGMAGPGEMVEMVSFFDNPL